MPTLTIGRTHIDYELRRSATALERRITVTPERVEVLALSADDDDTIAGFLNRKRQWVLNTVREVKQIAARRHAVPQFMTGSKIPFRGRHLTLTVRHSDADRMEITYRNGFIVDLPSWVDNDADELVASELKLWLRQRARKDVADIARHYGTRFGLSPRSIRVADIISGWGSCGAEGNVLINWQLIFAPKKVLEYVVVHELAHLQHRSHGKEFWDFLRVMIPDYEVSKAWLDKHQSELSADFLTP
jgi:predicted metal-dependent hydrolase